MASALEEPLGAVSMSQTRGSIAGINELHTKLYLQEIGLRDLLQRVSESCQNSKENVKKLFSEIKDMLFNKELEICDSIDAKTSDVSQTIETCLQKTEVNIEFILSVDDHSSSSEFLDDAVNNTNTCLQQGEMLMTRQIVAFKVDASVKSKVENFKYGEFTDASDSCRTERIDIGVDTCNSDNSMVGRNDIRVTENCTTGTGSLATADQQAAGIETAEEGMPRRESDRDVPVAQELRDASTSNALPSAPTLTDFTLNCEDPPPPYWQAVGLTGPSCEGTVDPTPTLSCGSMTQCSGDVFDVPDGTDVEPSAPQQPWSEFFQERHVNNEGTDMISQQWVLRRHHSFSLCSPDKLYKLNTVALCSHKDIVCVADKSNSCIGFFTEDGVFLDSAAFETPVYDVQFFKDDGGASCFAATFPRQNGFKLLYFKADRVMKDWTRFIKPHPGHRYTSVCKGPIGVPFLGASAQRQPHVVMTFDFGNCQTEFLNDGVNFLYPRSCLSYDSNVIVSDLTLGLVCVFQSNGLPLGRYTGTRQYPLECPTDMTISPNGNIYIVSGRLATIHVIDQGCNFLCALKVPESQHDKPKLIEYLANSKRLAVVRESGEKIELFDLENMPYCSRERSGSAGLYNRSFYETQI